MAAPVIRTISGEIDFGTYLREHSIPINTADQKSLIDINLSFYTLPGYYDWRSGRELLGCEDIRMYISGENVTSSLKEQLKLIVSAIPTNIIHDAYLAGAQSYITFVKQLGLYSAEIAKDEQFVQAYASDADWVSKFINLGDRNVGWMGNLHPLSFLFRYIPSAPISLKAVWQSYQEKSGKRARFLADVTPLV